MGEMALLGNGCFHDYVREKSLGLLLAENVEGYHRCIDIIMNLGTGLQVDFCTLESRYSIRHFDSSISFVAHGYANLSTASQKTKHLQDPAPMIPSLFFLARNTARRHPSNSNPRLISATLPAQTLYSP